MSLRKKLIGSRAFYAAVLSLLIPMIVQQGITQFVNLLDNVMVGRLGTTPMSGVAIVNQIVFIFNLTIFGGLGGASIFGAQFFGKKDYEGVRYTLRFRLVFSMAIGVLGILVFLLFGPQLFQLYLNEGASTPEEIASTLGHAQSYMNIILWGLLPFALVQCFSSTLRDVGETFSPMVASVIAICVNLVGNYLLIFGSFGFPKMGVAGAALATVISRYVEMSYLLLRTYLRRQQFPFVQGLFRGFRVPFSLIKQIAITGTPLLLNETLWSIGTAAVNMCYAIRGLQAVAATNINSTVWNLFAIVMMALGNAIGILSGQLLGANDVKGAKDTVRKLLFFSVCVNLVIGGGIIACSPFIPAIYNTEPAVRQTATQLLIISGAFLPLTSYVHGTYFTIRSGGKTFITFLFDCVFTWVVNLPVAFCLCHFTGLSVVWVFFCVSCADIIKAIIGTAMLVSGIWIHNVVDHTTQKRNRKEEPPMELLETPRLTLRKFRPEDLEALFQLLHDKEVNRFLPWFPVETLEEAQAFYRERIQGQRYFFAICLKGEDRPMGYVKAEDGDSYDFGYALGREHWHQGLTTEAARALVGYLRQEGIPFITATHDRENPRSGGVMRQLGMRYCYSYLEQVQPKDIPVIFRMYQLDLDGQKHPPYGKYWDIYPTHFVEEGL